MFSFGKDLFFEIIILKFLINTHLTHLLLVCQYLIIHFIFCRPNNMVKLDISMSILKKDFFFESVGWLVIHFFRVSQYLIIVINFCGSNNTLPWQRTCKGFTYNILLDNIFFYFFIYYKKMWYHSLVLRLIAFFMYMDAWSEIVGPNLSG